MRLSPRLLAITCAATGLLGHVTPAAATTCQVPLTIGQSTGEANVMIMLDNSGSMNEAIVADAYNPLVTYPGSGTTTFTKGTSYNVSVSGNYTPKHF